MSAVEKGSVEALLLQAVDRGEIVRDTTWPSYGYRWNGTPVNCDMGNKLAALAEDGLIDFDDTGGVPVRTTPTGREVRG